MDTADRVRERWVALQDGAEVFTLRERCERAVVEERTVPFRWRAYFPQPFAMELADEGSGELARLGVDAAGRAVIQHLREDLFQLFDWADEHCEMVEINGSLRRLQRFVFSAGRLVEVASTEGVEALDGCPSVETARWFYDGDRPSLVIETYASAAHPSWGYPERGLYWRAKAYTFVYDAAGELATVTRYMGTRDLAEGGDIEDAQIAARAGFPAHFESEEPFYDARMDRPETDLPDLDHADDGLAEALADAMFAAVEQQRDALGPLEFVAIRPARFPYQAVAADASFVDRAVAMGNDVRELLAAAYRVPPGTVLADAIDAAPPELLRWVRARRQAHAHAYRHGVHEMLLRELVSALNACPWSHVAPTFLVLTHPAPEDHDQEDPIEPTLESLDTEAFLASLDPALSDEQKSQRLDDHIDALIEAPRPRRIAWPDLEAAVGRERIDAFIARLAQDADTAPAPEESLPQSREELAARLTGAGLTDDEARRVASDALWGIPLEPGGTGRSRLGGAPILPAKASWPHADGRPLTHLATIALDELPDVEGRECLPADGTLTFFADLSEEGGLIEPVEPSEPWGHDLVAVIHAPDGTPHQEPTPPGEALNEQRVTPVARLQLRHLGFGHGKRLFGLDALTEQAVVKLAERINGSVDHQLLGYPRAAQDDPRRPGQIVVLHIADDPALGFMVMDAGDLHFLGTPTDIQAMRWDQLTVWPNSG